MFKKLNIDFSELDFDKLKGKDLFHAVRFKQYDIEDTDYVFEVLKDQVQFNILPEMNITEITYPGAAPHTDNWPTAINFYFDTGNDETFFWKKIHSVETIANPGLVYHDNSTLEKISSFIANKGDCYLLDVGNSIHSVKIYTPITTRKILRLYWRNLSFNEVLHNLKMSR